MWNGIKWNKCSTSLGLEECVSASHIRVVADVEFILFFFLKSWEVNESKFYGHRVFQLLCIAIKVCKSQSRIESNTCPKLPIYFTISEYFCRQFLLPFSPVCFYLISFSIFKYTEKRFWLRIGANEECNKRGNFFGVNFHHRSINRIKPF